MYSATTRDIEVRVTPSFMQEESRPQDNHYFWAYEVVISNRSDEQIQLISRYWHIVDGNGQVEEVRGNGVVGEQPVIAPQGQFTYTSGCPLHTSHGIMSGHYLMKGGRDTWFEVRIPAFSLDLPGVGRVLN